MVLRPAALDWASIDTCVFDMDGTLLDLYFDDQVWNQRLPMRYGERAGLAPDAARAYVASTLEAARGTLTWYCMDHWSRVFGLELNDIEQELQALISVRPGVETFLARLREHKLQVVLATNAHPTSMHYKLNHTGIGGYFDDVISSHEFGFAKEEQGFWQALQQRVELDPQRTVFMDDNLAVLEAARVFGIRYLFAINQPSSRGPQINHPGYHAVTCFSEFA